MHWKTVSVGVPIPISKQIPLDFVKQKKELTGTCSRDV
jgi:hypothetical protein